MINKNLNIAALIDEDSAKIIPYTHITKLEQSGLKVYISAKYGVNEEILYNHYDEAYREVAKFKKWLRTK